MSEVTSYAYAKIRDLFENTLIKYIEFQDGSGTPVIRIPTSDPRVTHTYNSAQQEQTYTIVIKGSDADITLEDTIAKSVFFESSTSTDPISAESFTAFQFMSAADQLTITHKIQIPQVV